MLPPSISSVCMTLYPLRIYHCVRVDNVSVVSYHGYYYTHSSHQQRLLLFHLPHQLKLRVSFINVHMNMCVCVNVCEYVNVCVCACGEYQSLIIVYLFHPSVVSFIRVKLNKQRMSYTTVCDS